MDVRTGFDTLPASAWPLSEAQREALILASLPFVRTIALRMVKHMSLVIDVEDLIQSGILGLCDAIKRYDPLRNVAFKSYAEWRVHGSMMDYVRGGYWESRWLHQKVERIAEATFALEGELAHRPSEEEVAAHLGVPPSTVAAWKCAARAHLFLSLDTHRPLHGHRLESETVSLINVASRAMGDTPEFLALRASVCLFLRTKIEALSPRQRSIIEMYYDDEWTMKAIGERLGLGESRISQMHGEAIGSLREAVSQEGWLAEGREA